MILAVSSWPGPNGTGTVASSPESVITHGKTMRGVDKGDPGEIMYIVTYIIPKKDIIMFSPKYLRLVG